MNFLDFKLSPAILSALESLGYQVPTPIQEKAIPVLLEGDRDFIGLAQTGTGKTAAFGLPLIHRVDVAKKATQALIVAPTRELCLQITKELQKFAQNIPTLSIEPIYGGVSMDTQIRALRRGVHIVVGTPGRLIDHLNRKTLSCASVETVVLDEADQMFDLGFHDDIHAILRELPTTRRVWLFSATMPRSVEEVAQRYMVNPIKVEVAKRGSSVQNLEHHYTVVRTKDQYAALRRFIDFYPSLFGMLFCRTKREVKEIADQLIKDGYRADALHGDLSQAQRELVMNRFRAQQVQLLVATDVAARGIDVNNITHVIHFGFPEDLESYTHRSGRTARAGKSGISIAIITSRDVRRVSMLERHIGKQISQLAVPTPEQTYERQLEHVVTLLGASTLSSTQRDQLLPKIASSIAQMQKEDLAVQLIGHLLAPYLQRSEDTAEIQSDVFGARSGSGSSNQPRLFINIGMIDGYDKKTLAQFVAQQAKISVDTINSVYVQRNHSYLGFADAQQMQTVVKAFTQYAINGRSIRVEPSSFDERRSSGGRPSYGRSGGGSYRGGERRSHGGGYGSSRSRSYSRPAQYAS